MDARANRRKSLVLTSLMLVGPFAFIEALLFRPKMLTPYFSGELDVVPVELQTMTTVLVLLVMCLVGRRLLGQFSPRAVALVCSLAPLACVPLIATFRNEWTPVVVACILAASCGLLLRVVLVERPFDISATLEDYGLSATITLGASSLLSHVGYWFAIDDAHGTMTLASIMGIGGLLVFVGIGRKSSDGVGNESASSGSVLDEAALLQLRQSTLLNMLFPVVPAGLICSLSLGMSSNDLDIEPLVRSGVPFALGCVATFVVLLALVARWRHRSEERDGDIVLFMTVPCALSVAATVAAGVLDFRWIFAVLVCSNLTFLALIWIDMLFLTGRKLFASSAAPVAALVVVLLTFCLGMLFSAVLPASIVTVLAPLGAVAYLVYLVFFFQHKAEEGAPVPGGLFREGLDGAPALRLSYDEIRLAACRAMAGDFGLSPKEAEVLPLLVTGISAAAIGRQLFVSHETVKTHKYHIYQKLGTHNYEETIEVFERYANEAAGSRPETEEKTVATS